MDEKKLNESVSHWLCVMIERPKGTHRRAVRSWIPCCPNEGRYEQSHSTLLIDHFIAPIAQLVVHLACNEKVSGSNPLWG